MFVVNKLAADLIKTTRDRSVGTDCNNLLISTDLLQVVISDLLSLVSNRLVASCFNKSLRLCCQQLATDLFPQVCYRLTKPTDLSRLVDNLLQAGKINSLRQTCEISGCVIYARTQTSLASRMCTARQHVFLDKFLFSQVLLRPYTRHG